MGIIMKRKQLMFFLLFAILFIPARLFAAGATFSATLPNDASVTMDNTTGTISITVTNTSSVNKKLKFFQFRVNSNFYNYSSNNTPPINSGWMVKEINNSESTGVALLEFSAEKSWAELSIGDSVTFDIILTGPNGGTILQDNTDKTDTFLSVKAYEKGTAPPPGIYGDEATLDGSTPTWTRHGLKCEFFISPNAMPVGETLYGSLSIVNVSSTDQSVIVTQNLQNTGTGSATLVNDFSPSPVSLTSNETVIMGITFTAATEGNIIFKVDTNNANVSSKTTFSNEINIGNFTATLKVTPDDVADGNEVTITLSTTNSGTSSLHNITPSATPVFSGSANATLVSGPDPASLSILSPGETYYFFTYTYRITGDAGDDYTFSSEATCDEGQTTNTAISNTGIISVFAYSVYPVSINSGNVDQTFTFNIQNGGKAKIILESVEIFHPSSDFIFGSASGGYNVNWTVTDLTDRIRFEAPTESDAMPGGNQMDLTITYSQTPSVVSTTDYRFDALLNGATNINVFGTDSKFDFTENKTETIYVTNTVIELEYEPIDLSADGNAETTLTLTLLDGDIAMPDQPIDFQFVFTGTYEQNPFWITKDSITDEQGQATAKFRAPYNASSCSVTVKGVFGTTESQIVIPFIGYDRPNILYSGNLIPIQVDPGATAQFSVDVRNSSENYDMNLTTNSYFLVSDVSLGGTTEYKAYLSSPTNIPTNEVIVTLTFEIKNFPTSFMQGQFKPKLFFTDGDPGNDQIREVSDKLIVGSGNTGIRIIDWRIKR